MDSLEFAEFLSDAVQESERVFTLPVHRRPPLDLRLQLHQPPPPLLLLHLNTNNGVVRITEYEEMARSVQLISMRWSWSVRLQGT